MNRDARAIAVLVLGAAAAVSGCHCGKKKGAELPKLPCWPGLDGATLSTTLGEPLAAGASSELSRGVELTCPSDTFAPPFSKGRCYRAGDSHGASCRVVVMKGDGDQRRFFELEPVSCAEGDIPTACKASWAEARSADEGSLGTTWKRASGSATLRVRQYEEAQRATATQPSCDDGSAGMTDTSTGTHCVKKYLDPLAAFAPDFKQVGGSVIFKDALAPVVQQICLFEKGQEGAGLPGFDAAHPCATSAYAGADPTAPPPAVAYDIPNGEVDVMAQVVDQWHVAPASPIGATESNLAVAKVVVRVEPVGFAPATACTEINSCLEIAWEPDSGALPDQAALYDGTHVATLFSPPMSQLEGGAVAQGTYWYVPTNRGASGFARGNSLDLRHLPTGDYTLRVTASDAAGNVSPPLERRLHLTNAPQLKLEATDALRTDAAGTRYLFPCHHDCEGKTLFKAVVSGHANVDKVLFQVLDASGEVDFEQELTQGPTTQDVFSCRTSGTSGGAPQMSHDAANADNCSGTCDVGASYDRTRWKYLDPGTDPSGRAAFKARVRVTHTDATPPADSAEINFEARQRDLWVVKLQDPAGFGPSGRALMWQQWGFDLTNPDVEPESSSQASEHPRLFYDWDGTDDDGTSVDFPFLYSLLTPRGTLITVSHGGFLDLEGWDNPDEAEEDGSDLFGMMDFNGDETFPGFTDDGTLPGTILDPPVADVAPTIELGNFRGVHGVTVDLRHCFTSHHSSWDDSGLSVAETLSAALNPPDGPSQATVIGYTGVFQISIGFFSGANFLCPSPAPSGAVCNAGVVGEAFHEITDPQHDHNVGMVRQSNAHDMAQFIAPLLSKSAADWSADLTAARRQLHGAAATRIVVSGFTVNLSSPHTTGGPIPFKGMDERHSTSKTPDDYDKDNTGSSRKDTAANDMNTAPQLTEQFPVIGALALLALAADPQLRCEVRVDAPGPFHVGDAVPVTLHLLNLSSERVQVARRIDRHPAMLLRDARRGPALPMEISATTTRPTELVELLPGQEAIEPDLIPATSPGPLEVAGRYAGGEFPPEQRKGASGEAVECRVSVPIDVRPSEAMARRHAQAAAVLRDARATASARQEAIQQLKMEQNDFADEVLAAAVRDVKDPALRGAATSALAFRLKGGHAQKHFDLVARAAQDRAVPLAERRAAAAAIQEVARRSDMPAPLRAKARSLAGALPRELRR